jgi:hypothetical protein
MANYQNWSAKSREILDAKEQAEETIEQDGITYDFELMEYVDQSGSVIPCEEVSKRQKHLIEQIVERKIDW